MVFLLNQSNVFDYLAELGYHTVITTDNIELISAKNFNLLLTLDKDTKLLVKQERHNDEGKAIGDFLGEWQTQELIKNYVELNHLQASISEVLHFDIKNSILIFKYLTNYQNLMSFYLKENFFSVKISQQVGILLATVHRDTYERLDYRDAISQDQEKSETSTVERLIHELEQLTPDIFGSVPDDGIRFYTLYQKYDSLSQALLELGNTSKASCLTHNDLKLNNILLHNNWEQQTSKIIRLIDWERSAWGDPAFDLGTLIGSYLYIWLSSLVVSKSLSIEESLSLVMIPLDQLQPSITALTQAYLQVFPVILESRPDFLQRAVQFAGLALIQGILATIQHQKTLGNSSIARLQVAKALLCRPVQSMPTVFGKQEIIPGAFALT